MKRSAGTLAFTLLVATVLLVPAAWADPAATPEAHAFLEKYAPDTPWDKEPELTALYTRLLETSSHDNKGITVVRDIEYGPDVRNRLDVHSPKSARNAPVLIFVHGGGFTEGDKNLTPAIYSNIGNYFARNGVVGIVIRYRLAPAHQWPSGTEDVAAAVKWAQANAARYGGDPRKIFLAGQSAGAALVSSYVFTPKPASDDGVAGVLLLSGVYTADPMFSVYYGTDESKHADRSPMNHLSTSRSLPTLVAFAEYDPIPVTIEAGQLIQGLCARDKRCPVVKQVVGHNHLSMVLHIDTADDSVAGDMLAFVKRNSKR